jgi:hypothetical protein
VGPDTESRKKPTIEIEKMFVSLAHFTKQYKWIKNLQFMLHAPPRCTKPDGPYRTPPPGASTMALNCLV